ncbi:MAG: hypothetical protein LAO78_18190 [Acidobacteriia bacterium]|nr:hypothetical protein [Terriglobia bacterium]
MNWKSLTLEGSIYFGEDTDPDKLASHLADCLHQARADEVNVDGNRIAYTAGMFRMVGSWNPLVPFRYGELTVDPVNRQVRYKVGFRQLVVVGTVMVIFLFAFSWLSHAWQMLIFMPLMWLWLVGGNLAVGVVRFQGFVSRSIESSPCRAARAPLA